MPVKNITIQNEFNTLKTSSDLLIVDYFATWCGPCRVISPMFEELSNKPEYKAATFIKVDVDQLKTVAQSEGVTAMPTFIFYKKGKKIDEMKGADVRTLQTKVKQHVSAIANSGDSASSSKEYVRGMYSLNDKIDLKQIEIANATDGTTFRDLFTTSKTTLKSDSDEQLMIYIPFQESLRIHSLLLRVHKDNLAQAPSELQLYVNRPTILSFEDVDSVPATQVISTAEIQYDATGEALVSLRFVKFQRCNSLVIFIRQNASEDEVTMLDSIDLIGEVGAANSTGVIQKVDHEHA